MYCKLWYVRTLLCTYVYSYVLLYIHTYVRISVCIAVLCISGWVTYVCTYASAGYVHIMTLCYLRRCVVYLICLPLRHPQEWCTLSPLFEENRAACLRELQKLVEIREFFDFTDSAGERLCAVVWRTFRLLVYMSFGACIVSTSSTSNCVS